MTAHGTIGVEDRDGTGATPPGDLLGRVLDPRSRPDPYPLYARFHARPVCRQDDGTYVVAGHRQISALLRDPRLSSDARAVAAEPTTPNGIRLVDLGLPPGVELPQPPPVPFLFTDAPDHDRLRRRAWPALAAHLLGDRMRERITGIVADLLDAAGGRGAAPGGARRIDVVADLAHPLPITVISEVLGVPAEHHADIDDWSSRIAPGLDPAIGPAALAGQPDILMATLGLNSYLRELIAARRAEPGPDLVTALLAPAPDGSRLTPDELVATVNLLVVAGHETTTKLIGNAVLALVRRPDVLERVHRDPSLVPHLVEEVLRLDPPVQFRTRWALTDVDVDGVVVPAGSTVVLLLAAGNRDPRRYPDPDRLDIDRTGSQHLAFGGGVHYCLGAPLARLEAEIALVGLLPLLPGARLVADPPPYLPGAALRGTSALLLDLAPAAPSRTRSGAADQQDPR